MNYKENFASIRFILIFSSISFESGVLAPKLKSEPLGFSRVTSAEISLLKKKTVKYNWLLREWPVMYSSWTENVVMSKIIFKDLIETYKTF